MGIAAGTISVNELKPKQFTMIIDYSDDEGDGGTTWLINDKQVTQEQFNAELLLNGKAFEIEITDEDD